MAETSRTSRGVLLALLTAFTAGCGGGSGEPRPSTLTLLVGADEHMLGPNWDIEAKFLVFEPLVQVDAEGNPQPRLLRAWEQREEGVWLLHVDTGARWHDGVPVTAHDIAFSVELQQRPDVGYMSPSISTDVLDDSTLVWTSSRKDPFDDYQTYYPKHLLADLDPTLFYEWDYWLHPVGNGPYRHVRTLEGRAMEFEAVASYYRGRPAIDRVIVKFGQNPVPELLSGGADAAQIQPIDALGLVDDVRFQIVAHEHTGSLVQIYWNLRHPVAGDPDVRRAATLAIDRRELAGALTVPVEMMTITDVPITPGLVSQRPEPLPFDPAAARRLLDAAGWRDENSDGIRERGGERLTIRLVTEIPSVAVYVQQRLAEIGIGIETDIRPGTGMVWPSLRDLDFEAALTWFEGGNMLGSESVLGYDNPAVSALLAQRDTTPDPVTRDSLLRETWPFLQRDLPITYLYPYVNVWAVTKRLKGWTPRRANPLQFLADLWLEE